MQDGGIGKDGALSGEKSEGFDGKVFELVGENVARFGQALEGVRIVEGGGESEISHGGGGAGGVGIEDGDAVAHAASSESEHATELTAADDAYGLAWRDHGR